MDKIGVWMTCPMSIYLQDELTKRFNLFKSWEIPSKPEFFNQHSRLIRAVVGNGVHGADSTLIESLPSLEIVSSHSSGLDQIDLGKCKEKGIRVTSTPDALTDEVSGKPVGIIGLGRIGSAIAKRLEAFTCPISYYSRSEKPNSGYKYYPNVIELASSCEILVVACSLTEATHHIINHEVIDALGPKGILVNIGRGGHVDEPELVSALVEGRLGGAGLDVFEHEPDVPEQLTRLDNVVLSPHVGTCTEETRKAIADLVVANLEAHFSNKPLLTPVV